MASRLLRFLQETEADKYIEYDLRSPTFILLLVLVVLVLFAICLIIFCFRSRKVKRPQLVSKEAQTEIVHH